MELSRVAKEGAKQSDWVVGGVKPTESLEDKTWASRTLFYETLLLECYHRILLLKRKSLVLSCVTLSQLNATVSRANSFTRPSQTRGVASAHPASVLESARVGGGVGPAVRPRPAAARGPGAGERGHARSRAYTGEDRLCLE